MVGRGGRPSSRRRRPQFRGPPRPAPSAGRGQDRSVPAPRVAPARRRTRPALAEPDLEFDASTSVAAAAGAATRYAWIGRRERPARALQLARHELCHRCRHGPRPSSSSGAIDRRGALALTSEYDKSLSGEASAFGDIPSQRHRGQGRPGPARSAAGWRAAGRSPAPDRSPRTRHRRHPSRRP
jgi:hypothetical protein